MTALFRTERVSLLFYLVLMYVLTCFCWWTYLHIQNIEKMSNLEIERVMIQSQLKGSDIAAITKATIPSSTKLHILEKYQRQRTMIIGESTVFILLILFFFYKTHLFFRKK